MDPGESSYRRFLDGDNEGLHEIIREYHYGLMLYLNSYVGNVHVAEDLTEDTFAELAVRKPRFHGRCRFKTWLYAIGRNITCKYIRKDARNRSIPLSSAEDIASEENIEAAYLRDERSQMLHRAMKTLRTEYRQVLMLSFFEELSNEEVAMVMKRSKRQIENLLYNSKKALRAELERSGFSYEEQ